MKNIVLIPETENLHELNKTYYHFMFGLLIPIIDFTEKFDTGGIVYVKGINSFGKFKRIVDEIRGYGIVDIRIYRDGIKDCEYYGLNSFENYYTKSGNAAERVYDSICIDNFIAKIDGCYRTDHDKIYDVVFIDRISDVSKETLTHRIIPNIREIAEYIRSKGFTTRLISINNVSLFFQMEMFLKTENIVAQHGSALSNLLFFTGIRVIEIMPECFEKTGLDYYGRLCEQLCIDRKVISQKFINSPVDPDEVLKCLRD